jgi:hypothetical protein
MNANLSDYRVPVNADIGEIDVSTIGISDPHLDSLGVRGIGEIGITGTGAAIVNAIYTPRESGSANYRSRPTNFFKEIYDVPNGKFSIKIRITRYASSARKKTRAPTPPHLR